MNYYYIARDKPKVGFTTIISNGHEHKTCVIKYVSPDKKTIIADHNGMLLKAEPVSESWKSNVSAEDIKKANGGEQNDGEEKVDDKTDATQNEASQEGGKENGEDVKKDGAQI